MRRRRHGTCCRRMVVKHRRRSATAATLGATYFTAAKPAECSAAILFLTGLALISRLGGFRPMKLTFSASPSDDVLVWTMARQDWTCDYGLAVVATIALMLSNCDAKPGSRWLSGRKAAADR